MKWYSPKEKLPEKSCEVIVACGCAQWISTVMNVDYSDKHKKFNCQDICDPKFANEHGWSLTAVLAWAYMDEFESEILQFAKENEE